MTGESEDLASAGTPDVTRRSGSDRGRTRRRTMRTSAALMMVVALILLATSASTMPISVTQESTGDRTFIIGDLTVQGGIYRDDIRVEFDDGKAALIYMGDAEKVYWAYKDNSLPVFECNGDTYSYRSYEIVVGDTLVFSEPGCYNIKIWTDGSISEGLIILDGDITQEFGWCRTIDGQIYRYTTAFTYSFGEYYNYVQSDTPRHQESTLPDSRFVTVDDPILRLSAALEEEYEKVHGERVPGSQDYVDYLLSFVQCCISYPDVISWNGSEFVKDSGGYADLYLYGTEEYWAYPLETLYFECGDCEDTAFLMSSLMSVSGYLSVLVTLPNHMVSAVMLDDFTPEFVEGYANEPIHIMGMDMPVCEATFSHYVPLGCHYHSIEPTVETPITYVTVMPYRGQVSG